MENKTIAPAVWSAKQATKKALEMKSFMNERIAASQLQIQINRENRIKKAEEEAKIQEQKTNEERKIAQHRAKEDKEKNTDKLVKSIKGGI